MTAVAVEVSVGELIDKMTILEIKSERLADPSALANVRAELEVLRAARDAHVARGGEIDGLTRDLKAVNETLWDIENGVRRHERDKDFGDGFIELVRAVYINNDERSRIKRRINELSGSRLVEEKSYTDY